VGISNDGAASFASDYRAVFDAVCAATVAEGMSVSSADPGTGVITISSSVSAMSWGENGVIKVSQQEGGTTVVNIHSSLKFGLVDWGRNRRNIERLLARVESVLTNPPPSDAAWHPDPTGRHQLRYWDGTSWTANVSDDGATAFDPL
jgi:hypothetical protein